MSFSIDISTLKDGSEKEILYNYQGELHFQEDNIEECSVDTKLRITDIGEGIYIKGALNISLKLTCSRCINAFPYTNDINIEEVCNYHEEDPCGDPPRQ